MIIRMQKKEILF